MILLTEAAAIVGDEANVSVEDGFSEALGGAGGGFAGTAAGAAAGAGLLFGGAASGLAGAATLSSGLAGAGAIIGGGMAAGIGVVAAPALLLGAAGVWAGKSVVERYNNSKLRTTKEALLHEVVRALEALTRSLPSKGVETTDSARNLIAQLKAAESNLKKDLNLV